MDAFNFHCSFLCRAPSGVFITKGDVGVGTIVGSAVFNILVIIGLSGIFAGQVEKTFLFKLTLDALVDE